MTMNKKFREQPFGDVFSAVPRVVFNGSPDDLNAALGMSMHKTSAKKNSTLKVKKTVRDPNKKLVVKKPDNPKPLVAKTAVKKKKAKPFDRNRDGPTDAELHRAKSKLLNLAEINPKMKELFTERLDSYTNDLTNFLVTEIAPFDCALEVALSDASDMIRMITGSADSEFSLGKAERIINKLPELKIIDFICERLQIPADIRMTMIAEYVGAENGQRLSQLQTFNNLLRQEKESNTRLRQLLNRKSADQRKSQRENRVRRRSVESGSQPGNDWTEE